MKTKRILFVDDDKELVTSSTRLIEIFKRDTEPAYSGFEAIEKVRSGDYHLIILDIKLPDISGFEVVKRIREFNKNIHIVLITGHPEFQLALTALNFNVDEILLKPIAPKELARICHDYSSPIRFELSQNNLEPQLK